MCRMFSLSARGMFGMGGCRCGGALVDLISAVACCCDILLLVLTQPEKPDSLSRLKGFSCFFFFSFMCLSLSNLFEETAAGRGC